MNDDDCDAPMYECDCRVCMERFYALHCDPVPYPRHSAAEYARCEALEFGGLS